MMRPTSASAIVTLCEIAGGSAVSIEKVSVAIASGSYHRPVRAVVAGLDMVRAAAGDRRAPECGVAVGEVALHAGCRRAGPVRIGRLSDLEVFLPDLDRDVVGGIAEEMLGCLVVIAVVAR